MLTAAASSFPHSSRAREAHGVEPLRVLAEALGVAVGEDVAAVDALDRPDLAARVAREPRVRVRVEVPRAHAVADGEARRRAAPRRLAPARRGRAWPARRRRAQHALRRRARRAAARARPARARSRTWPGSPAAGGPRARSATCRCSTRPTAPIASVSANTRRSHSAWNGGSSASAHDRAEAVRAAHVVRAVHSTPVPIIASRVTMRRQPLLVPALGAGRAHRHDEVADLGGRVPDADLGLRRAA